jgi:hypothetical protein
MDVYLEPLIDEILKLWANITMYDISKPIGQKQFQFHGILTWTIHDAKANTFLWYVNLQCNSIYPLLLHVFFEYFGILLTLFYIL